MKINRYPGVKPFSADEQALFFGRDRDIADLCDLMRVEKTCVLFGKSGYGKSSILQAGVLPRLAAECLPIEVRFGEYIAGQSLPPLENLRLALDKRAIPNPEMAFVKDLPDSLWVHFKKRVAHLEGVPHVPPGYLLVFDQFEEFFSYPAEQQRAFREQLAELLNDELPEHLREAARELPREQRRLLATASDIRLLITLRSDRLHELDRMKDYLPTLLHKRYELRALSREQAREAVLGPAKLEGDFTSPPFSYADNAIQRILTDLSRSNTTQQATGVEAFQLQILCDSIESKVAAGLVPDRDGDGLPDVMPEDLPDFSEVFGQYYERRLAHLPEAERDVARRVVEDGLVRLDPATGEGRRLSVDGDALLQQFGTQGLTSNLLRALEGTFLLRREPNTLGGYNYELSHDTLLAPITAAAKVRRQREEEERLRLEAERQKAEQEKIDAARRRNIFVGVGALALLLFAFYQNWEARKAKVEAEAMTTLAKEKTDLATRNDSIAQFNTTRADGLLREVEMAKSNIEKAEKELAVAQNATEAQKRLALQNLKEAEHAGEKVVHLILDNADQQIKSLNYIAAASTLENARLLLAGRESSLLLGPLRPLVAQAVMETAFFYVETDQYGPARSEIARALLLLDKPLPALSDLPWTTKPDPDLRARLREMLKSLDPVRFEELQRKYYGDFANIPGGTDTIGGIVIFGDSILPLVVTVSPFRMATTETTWWQYNLFSSATGYPEAEKPGWGSDGDNPVVKVSWYDAVVYCNWCSEREGLRPAYTIKDSMNRIQRGWEVVFDSSANGFRLPTETEWEYAARAGTEFEFAGDSLLEKVGWYGDNSGSRTRQVAQKKPNGLGLYDMSGNVMEWCYDWYIDYPVRPVKDYRGADEGSIRVLRGGSWDNYSLDCWVAIRARQHPDDRFTNVGFRVVRGY
ncbi:MAG: SUMF1/EgtB/PvdO family nonheme iron enzyme [Saprospiraceae bacterium]|nr:SUMF1/EgtB/PvdO family nonheme iron enzyme [Saprospiraceae bacterium]